MSDPIDDFIALPEDQQVSTLQQLSPDERENLLGQVDKRKPSSGSNIGPIGASGSPLKSTGSTKAGYPIYQGVPAGAGRSGMDFLKENASPILSTAGAIGGGALAGPPGAILGAGYGGYLGTGIERDTSGKPKSTGSEVWGGAKNAALEATGAMLAKPLARLLGPVTEKFAPKAIQHLTAAAAEKGSAGPAYEAITNTAADIEKHLLQLPPEQRTVDGFLDAVTTARQNLHNEYGNALGPYANQKADVGPIVKNLEDLKKDWMHVESVKGGKISKEGADQLKAIDDAILRFKSGDRTIGQLDSLRQQLNSDLAPYYAKSPNNKYTAATSNMDVAIDEAVARGARDGLYPVADQAAGMPTGYFKDVMDREGNLIKLRGILQKRVTDLGGAQAVSEVTPRLSGENVSLSVHAGSLPRGGIYGLKNLISPPRELTQAGKRVARSIVKSPDLGTLPYEVLLTTGARGKQVVDREKSRLSEILKPVPMQ